MCVISVQGRDEAFMHSIWKLIIHPKQKREASLPRENHLIRKKKSRKEGRVFVCVVSADKGLYVKNG